MNIYLDGVFGFGLDLENFMKLNLRVDQRLSDEEIEEIIRKGEFAKVYEKVLRFALLRPRSVKEIEDWMKRKDVHESIREELFIRLKKLDLIDDEKFASWWVDQRMSFRPKSRRILIQELRIKGIDRDIIENVLFEVSIDEGKIASDLLAKNKYKWERFEEKVAKQKKSEYLARKGFGWDVIKKAVG